jgi:hypothetical protein
MRKGFSEISVERLWEAAEPDVPVFPSKQVHDAHAQPRERAAGQHYGEKAKRQDTLKFG